MQDEVLDAALENAARQSAGFAAPVNDQPTNASSPSSLYANLTLDSSQGEMSTSPSNGNADSPVPDTADLASSPPTDPEPDKPSRQPRSSSPTKRPASDMEDETDADGHDVMELEREKISRASLNGGHDVMELEREKISRASLNGGHERRRSSATRSPTDGSDATTQSPPGSSTAATNLDAPSPDTSVQPTGDERSSRGSTPPSIDEQRSIVMQLIQKPLEEGQVGYLVATPWLHRVLARTSDARPGDFDKSAAEGEIGPVDNSSLFLEEWDTNLVDEKGQPFIPIRPDLRMRDDYEVLPEEAFTKIMEWYKVKSTEHIITRFVHDAAPEGTDVQNLMYEIYPPIFTLTKIGAGEVKNAPRILASRNLLFVTFLVMAKKALDISVEHKVRVWRRVETLPGVGDAESNTADADSAAETMLIDRKAFSDMAEGTQRELVDVKDESMNKNYNGHLQMGTIGLQMDQVLIFEEITTTAAKGDSKLTRVAGTKSLPASERGSRKSSPAPQHNARGRTKSKRLARRRAPGTVGLTNLGNTCFMNSALQCLKSVQELSIYFLNDRFREELNPDNPIGHRGQMAESYAALLKQLFESEYTVTPTTFKRVLGRCAPQFSGYQQHDSQELLSFLVDALHEDLNRILKKPYIENPESDDNTILDPQAVIDLGNQIRGNHAARNDSVIMDLFNGYYKNTMLCPDCEKTSITFDPYSLITVQLPIETPFQHTIRFVPADGQPVQLNVDLDRNASIKQLKQYICNQVGCDDYRRIFIFDVFQGRFYNHLLDNHAISECNLQPSDVIIAYEVEHVPSNFAATPAYNHKKLRSMLDVDEPLPAPESFEHTLVTVWHKAKSTPSSYQPDNNSGWILWPTLMVLTQEEAADRDLVFKKLLAKANQMTSISMWDEDTVSEATTPTSEEPVITTEEDASSNLDPSVKTRSVEGEDLLEVSTALEAAGTSKQGDAEEVPRDHAPAFLKPGEMIPPHLQNIFDVYIHKIGGGMAIPSGVNAGNDSQAAVSLEKRADMVANRDTQQSDNILDTQSVNSSDEEFSNLPPQQVVTPESDDEEDIPALAPALLPHKADGARRRERNKKFKKNVYGKQGRKGKGIARGHSHTPTPPPQQPPPRQSYQPAHSEDSALLVNSGEFLVCEWPAEVLDYYFGGKGENDSQGRGVDSMNVAPIVEDPEFEEKRARRNRRSRKGITLDECFAESAKTEILSEENVWYCGRCKDNVRAAKTLTVWTLPDILLVHLKRFNSNRMSRQKLSTLVDFPVEGLDLNEFVEHKDPGKDYTYDLFGVDNHMGGMGGGHYTAFAKNFIDGVWYNFNDSSVSTVSPESVVTSSAYLLFYRRRSAEPLGPAYLQQMVNDFNKPPPRSDDDADDDDTTAASRDTSLGPGSGNGKPLAGSSRRGSSRGSRAGSTAAGAGARRRSGGLGSSTGVANLLGADPSADEDARMIDADEDDDEDDAMTHRDDDGDSDFGETFFGVAGPPSAPPTYQSSWSFARIDRPRDDGSDDDDRDDDSMVAGGRSASSTTAAFDDDADAMLDSFEEAAGAERFPYGADPAAIGAFTGPRNNSPDPVIATATAGDSATMFIEDLKAYAGHGREATAEVRVGEAKEASVPRTGAAPATEDMEMA